MMMKAFDWFVVMCVVAVIIVCSVLLVLAQDSTTTTVPLITTTTTTVYEYDGWQHNTTLRSNTWNAEERTPQPNERLYIYEDGVKQQEYYEWNGYDWNARDGAFTNNNEEE